MPTRTAAQGQPGLPTWYLAMDTRADAPAAMVFFLDSAAILRASASISTCGRYGNVNRESAFRSDTLTDIDCDTDLDSDTEIDSDTEQGAHLVNEA